MNNKLITTSIFSILLQFTNLSYASDDSVIYKWVDSRGVTHYAESPPEDKDKIKAEMLNINRYVPRASAEAIKNLEQQRTERQEAQKVTKENKEGVKKTGETAKVDTNKAKPEYKERCTQYKNDLEALTSKGDRVRIQDANGEQRRMTSEEIAKKVDETKRNIKGFCE